MSSPLSWGMVVTGRPCNPMLPSLTCPMRTRIKICCLRSVEEARLAIAAGADAIGFIGVSPPTPRTIADARIAGIVALMPAPVETVLVTAARTADELSAQIRRTRPTTVQILHPIHPDESARLAQIKPDIRRVQAIHVEGPEVLDLIPVYAPQVHAFLLDSGKPHASPPTYGGTGAAHDWAVSAAFVQASPLPVFLAGGLTPDNIAGAIDQVRPFGVDLCSGVRSRGGLDPDKLAAFVRAVRQTDAITNAGGA